MPKPKFPVGSNLNRKLKKYDAAPDRRQENLEELCRFYGLDPTHFQADDTSPWRNLSEKLMQHFVPGFQVNKSGNKKRHSFASDENIAAWFDLCNDGKADQEHVRLAAKLLDMTQSQIRHALSRERTERAKLKQLGKTPYDEDLPDYFTRSAAEDRKEKNRKRQK